MKMSERDGWARIGASHTFNEFEKLLCGWVVQNVETFNNAPDGHGIVFAGTADGVFARPAAAESPTPAHAAGGKELWVSPAFVATLQSARSELGAEVIGFAALGSARMNTDGIVDVQLPPKPVMLLLVSRRRSTGLVPIEVPGQRGVYRYYEIAGGMDLALSQIQSMVFATYGSCRE